MPHQEKLKLTERQYVFTIYLTGTDTELGKEVFNTRDMKLIKPRIKTKYGTIGTPKHTSSLCTEYSIDKKIINDYLINNVEPVEETEIPIKKVHTKQNRYEWKIIKRIMVENRVIIKNIGTLTTRYKSPKAIREEAFKKFGVRGISYQLVREYKVVYSTSKKKINHIIKKYGEVRKYEQEVI